jgi:hypothetical protein
MWTFLYSLLLTRGRNSLEVDHHSGDRVNTQLLYPLLHSNTTAQSPNRLLPTNYSTKATLADAKYSYRFHTEYVRVLTVWMESGTQAAWNLASSR